jgi:hypothetical protein
VVLDRLLLGGQAEAGTSLLLRANPIMGGQAVMLQIALADRPGHAHPSRPGRPLAFSRGGRSVR